MNKKNVWTAIATILLPYLMLLALALIFLSTKLAFFEWIMQFVFWNNALLLILALLFCCILVAILNVLCFIANIRQKEDALALAKTAMIVKLTQIPAYVLIFVLGVLLLLTIFTIPFTIALFFFDCACLFLSGLWVASSAIYAIRQGICKPQKTIWAIILQFVFCADVVSSIVFYIMLKKSQKRRINVN